MIRRLVTVCAITMLLLIGCCNESTDTPTAESMDKLETVNVRETSTQESVSTPVLSYEEVKLKYGFQALAHEDSDGVIDENLIENGLVSFVSKPEIKL